MSKIAFDRFEIDLDLQSLSENGTAIEIGAKPLRVLLFLVQNRHRVVSAETLRESVWANAQLSPATIPTAIMSVRRALGDSAKTPRFIESLRGRGYRFVAEIRQQGIGIRRRDHTMPGETLPFVGRSETIADLNRLFRDVQQSSSGRIALISADAGIGKSRLIHEFLQQFPHDVRSLSTRATSTTDTPPFWPWSQLLRSALSGPTADSTVAGHARSLANVIPELANTGDETGKHGDTNKFNVFRRWTDCIFALAERGPTIITIDDVHSLDQDSLLLLYWIADEIENCPLFIVATSRPGLRDEPAANLMSDIEALPTVSRVQVGPLSADHIKSFLDPMSHSVDSLASSLLARTGGNAFYITHLLRCLDAIPDLDLDDRNIGGIPLHAREIVARQLSGLPTNCRNALAAASVLGDRFQIEALAQATNQPIDRAAEAIQPAISAWILRPTLGAYSFNHQLLRESLYRTLSESERKALHLRVAEHSSRTGPTPQNSSEIARHRIAALPLGDAETACEAALAAARAAVRRNAYGEARRLYGSAQRIHDSSCKSHQVNRQQILIELADAVLHCGDRNHASEILQEAAREARKCDDWLALATCALSIAPNFLTIEVGAWDPALVNLLEEALARIGDSNEGLRAKLLARLSIANQWNPAPSLRAEAAQEAIAISAKLGSDDVRVAALAAQTEVLNGPRHAPERLALTRELGDIARRLGHVPQILLHHTRSITALLELGDIESVDSENQKHKALASQADLPQYRWLSLATESMLATMRGDLAAAESLSASYLELAKNHIDANVVLTFGGQSLLRLVERDIRDLPFDKIDDIVREHPSIHFWRALSCWAKLVSGDLEGSADTLATFSDEDLSRIENEPGGGIGMAALAEVAASIGSIDQRLRTLSLLRGLDDRFVCAGYGVAYAGGFARYIALLERSIGNVEFAAELLRKATQGELKRRAPSWSMYALADLITTEKAAGFDVEPSIEDARELLRRYRGLDLPRAKRILSQACH